MATESTPTARNTSPVAGRESVGSCTTTLRSGTSLEAGAHASRAPYPPRTFTNRSSFSISAEAYPPDQPQLPQLERPFLASRKSTRVSRVLPWYLTHLPAAEAMTAAK